jgi:uroporphyrinogen decarboxylase
VTSITKAAYGPLRAHLGLPPDEAPIHDAVQQLPFLGEDLLERFAVDTRMVQLPPAHVAGVEVFDDGDYWAFHDRWGSKLRMPKVGGLYFDWVEYPIDELTPAALDGYRWPEPDPPALVATLRERARRLREQTDYALVGSGVIGGGIFEQPCRTVGLEQFMMAMLSDRPLAERLMDGITDIYIASVERYLDQVGEYIDVFTFWDDVATQDGWMISPELYVSLVKPRQRRLFEAIKARTDAKLFYHGCGAVFELIPHLIEIGVDIVNPVQVSARGMDSRRLKATYGNDVTFWGGGVDTQRVLPFGSPQDVRDEVRRRIDDLAPGGGFVFATVHNIQAFVPPENIVAAFDTAREYGQARAGRGAPERA